MIILKSKLYREEIKHWLLISTLIFWATFASYFALRNQSKTLLIGIDDSGARLIEAQNDRILQAELKSFLKSFLLFFYSYDEKSFDSQLESASNMMSASAWTTLKPKLLEIKSKLATTPISQTAEIESIDLIDQNKIEALLKINIKSRISDQIVKLKVRINFNKNNRTTENPWGYEVTEVSDNVL